PPDESPMVRIPTVRSVDSRSMFVVVVILLVISITEPAPPGMLGSEDQFVPVLQSWVPEAVEIQDPSICANAVPMPTAAAAPRRNVRKNRGREESGKKFIVMICSVERVKTSSNSRR